MTPVMSTTEEFSGARTRHKTRYHGFKHINILKRNLLLKYPQRVRARESMNCKDTIPKIRNKYSQKRKLGGLSPNFYIHVYVSDLCMYSDHRSANSAAGKEVDRSGEYKNRS
jgi:hypothetical protein